MFDPTKPMESQYTDPFANPFNPLTATRANWNIDPVYTTPGYTANFRPAYAGPQGYQTPMGNMGFWEGVSRGGLGGALGPDWQRMPMYMNPVQYQAAATNAALDPIQDGISGFGAGIAAPFAAFAMGEALTSMRVKIGARDAATGAGHYWAKMWGNAAPTTRTVSGAMGSAMGRGVASTMLGFAGNLAGGHGAAVTGSAIGQGIIGLSGGAGAVAGRLAMPIMAGQAIMSGFEHTFVDPYVAIRRGQKAFMGNFANQYLGEGGGRVTGFGMSRTRASNISTALTMDSVRDHAFDAGDYNIMADYASQAGMFNDIKDFDVDKIRSRMKNISSQVKTIMAVANEPSLQEAVKMLSKLKQSGATDVGGFAGTVLNNIAGNAAVSGISVQQMMNTVGATGQYLYQSQGLTPFIGMQQAGSIHSGFATAFRSGLIDAGALARMGGMEGATQSAMSAQLGLGRSNYNMMTLANQYMFRGANAGSWTGNIANFGANMANDPLGTMGLMSLYGNDMLSAQMQKDPTSVYDQIFQRMRDLPGQNSIGKFAAVGKGFGLSDDQLRSTIELLRSGADGDARQLKLGALVGKNKQSYMSTLAQHNMDYADSWASVPVHAWREMSSDFQQFGTAVGGAWNSSWARMGDWLEEKALGLKYNLGNGIDVGAKDFEARNFYNARMKSKGVGVDLSRYHDTSAMSDSAFFGTQGQGKKRSLSRYKSFFSAINGTQAGAALTQAIKSGDKGAIRTAAKGLQGELSKLGARSNDEAVDMLIADAQQLSGFVKDDMLYSEGRAASISNNLDRVYDGILGKDLGTDLVGSLGLIQRAIGMWDNGKNNLNSYLQNDKGGLTEEALAYQESLISAGVLDKSFRGKSVGDRVAALKQRIEDTAIGNQKWGSRGVLTRVLPDMRGFGNKEAAYQAFLKGNTFGLSKEQRGQVKNADDLQRLIHSGLSELGIQIQTGEASIGGMVGDTNRHDLLQAVSGLSSSAQATAGEVKKLNALRDAAGRMDFSAFEYIKASIDADLADKQVKAAEMQYKAAEMNLAEAEDRAYSPGMYRNVAANEDRTSRE